MPSYQLSRSSCSLRDQVKDEMAERPTTRLPVGRVLVALLVVPLFTSAAFFLPAICQERTNLRDVAFSLLSLPLAALVYA